MSIVLLGTRDKQAPRWVPLETEDVKPGERASETVATYVWPLRVCWRLTGYVQFRVIVQR